MCVRVSGSDDDRVENGVRFPERGIDWVGESGRLLERDVNCIGESGRLVHRIRCSLVQFFIVLVMRNICL